MRFSEFDFLIEGGGSRRQRQRAKRQQQQAPQQQAPQQQAPQQQAPQQQAAPASPAYAQQQAANQAQQQTMQYSLHGGSAPDPTDIQHINSWADAIQSGAHSPGDVPDVYLQYVNKAIQGRSLSAPARRTGPINNRVDKRADQIFINNFSTKLRNAKTDPQFDYNKFTQDYLTRNNYNTGVYKLALDQALDQAVTGKNDQADLALGPVMLKIAQANTNKAQVEMPSIKGMMGIPH